LTTNFVNIYMSSLAWKAWRPGPATALIWSIGIVGGAQRRAGCGSTIHQHDGARRAARAGRRRWLRYTFAARGWTRRSSPSYNGGTFRGVSTAGMVAWAAGAAFFAAGSLGGTLPALAVSVLVYRALLYTRPR
jgi:hypothetical protein